MDLRQCNLTKKIDKFQSRHFCFGRFPVLSAAHKSRQWIIIMSLYDVLCYYKCLKYVRIL